MASDRKTCFVIAPIGPENSDVRKRSDQVLKHIISPAADECGYETLRADQIDELGIITSQVIQHIVDDPLVIADLTGHNPNVFYELSLRHALKKPVVQIIDIADKIPFDVAHSRIIQVDHHDLDSVAQEKEGIVRQIRAVEKNPTDVDTPISVAIDLQLLRKSDNPIEKSNAEIITMLQDLGRIVSWMRDDLSTRISNIEHLLRFGTTSPYGSGGSVSYGPPGLYSFSSGYLGLRSSQPNLLIGGGNGINTLKLIEESNQKFLEEVANKVKSLEKAAPKPDVSRSRPGSKKQDDD